VPVVTMTCSGVQRTPRARPSVQLMRDPVCGVYVSPTKAITERSGVGIAYFCSERCRQSWRQR